MKTEYIEMCVRLSNNIDLSSKFCPPQETIWAYAYIYFCGVGTKQQGLIVRTLQAVPESNGLQVMWVWDTDVLHRIIIDHKDNFDFPVFMFHT